MIGYNITKEVDETGVAEDIYVATTEIKTYFLRQSPIGKLRMGVLKR